MVSCRKIEYPGIAQLVARQLWENTPGPPHNFISGCSAVGSAPALGAGCRRFESCHSDQTKSSVNSFVCGTFSFIPAANVPMLGFAVFDFIRRNRDFQGHLGVLDVGLSVSSLLFAFRAGSISSLFRVSKRHLHRTLSDILTALVMIL